MKIKLTPDGIELNRPLLQSAHTVDYVRIIERAGMDGYDMVIGYRCTGEKENRIEAFATDIEFVGDEIPPGYAERPSTGAGSPVKYTAWYVFIFGSDGTPKYISLLSVDRT